MISRNARAVLLAGIVAISAPAPGQMSQSLGYQFLQAVKDAKGDDVEKLLNQPGTVVINSKDYSSGEGALHIVVRRGDETYLNYLLSRRANPDLQDNKGNTPMMVAATTGQAGLIQDLLKWNANVDLPNNSGETPLIRAVQRRDLAMARMLIAAGADPDRTDVISGQSARDYAHADRRTPSLAKLIDETPKKVRRAVAGPKL